MPVKFAPLLQQLSPTLAVLIALSLITLTLGLERLYVLVQARRALATRKRVLLAHLGDGAASAALQANKQLPEHMTESLFGAILQNPSAQPQAIRRQQARIVRGARRRLWILGSIGSIAPFVGLLGTVLGVMEAFAAMGSEGAGGFAVVSMGLSEALITTAAGIFVAVEAVLLFNGLQVLTALYGAELKEAAEEVAEQRQVAHGA
jgi:biopolymer transport protein ExbB